MRSYPDDEDGWKDIKRLNAAQWMIDALKLNPDYTHWGPHEEYMLKEGSGWNSRVIKKTWQEFGPWKLDDYNEVVHFYFEIGRDSKPCEPCGGKGYHPDALWVIDSWYRRSSPFTLPTAQERMIQQGMHDRFGSPMPVELHGRGAFPSEELLAKYKPEFRKFCEDMRDGDGYWANKLTQDEVDALVADGRLGVWDDQDKKWTKVKRTADEVNVQSKDGLHHDAINSWVASEARLKRFGMPKFCPTCEGEAILYTAPAAHLGLVLWMIHPRKGASRGVEIETVTQDELPQVIVFLKEAAKRNAERFSKIAEL